MYLFGLAQPTAASADLTPFVYMIFANFMRFVIHANVSLRLSKSWAVGEPEVRTRVLRLGDSLGCKLHLLAPDAGRGCWWP